MSADRDLERQPLLTANDVLDHAAREQQTIEPASAAQPILSQGSNHGVSGTSPPKAEWKVVLAIASSWIGVVLASMDASVVATLTGPISESFDSFQLMSWFINAYLVTSATVQPLSGKLSDIYGRRAGLLLSNLLFLVGNLICGIATKDWHFILGRAVAGLGGGAIHSISTFLISDLIPLRSRGFWQGVSNIAYGSGFAIGGYFGGAINDRFGWRWAFLSQPIMIAVSIILVYCLLEKTASATPPSLRRIDFLGSVTLTLALLCLLYGAISGGNTLPWSSPLVYMPLIISPLLLVVYGYIEERVAKEPIIPVRLLRVPSILGACLTYWFNMMGYACLMFYVPLLLEVKGVAAAGAGLRLTPSAIGVFIGSIGSGVLMNLTGKYYLLGLGGQLGQLAAGTLVLTLISKVFASWPPFLFMLLFGVAFGVSLTVMLLAIISAADHEHHATLTSASYAFRSTGQVLGVTIAGAIFQNSLSKALWANLGEKPGAADRIDSIRHKLSAIKDLPPEWRSGVSNAYEIAFRGVWVYAVAAFVASVFTAAIIREHRLHKTLDRK